MGRGGGAGMTNMVCKLVRLPLAALVLAPGGAALAQAAPGAAVRSDLTFSLTARYDSNVPRLSDEALDDRGLEKADIRISPAAQLYVSRNLGRHQVALRSSLGYDFYIRNTQLNRERISVEPSAYLNLPVCDLAVSGLASRQQSDLGELVYVGIDPTIGANNTETRKRINGKLICGDTYGLRPTFEIEHATGDNSNPLRQIADYRVTRIQPGVGYSSPTLGEISIYAVRQDTDLPNQLLPNGEQSGYTLRGFGLSYGRAIGTRLTFNGNISQVELAPYDGGNLDTRSGINGSVSLTLLASERLQFTAFANRSFTSTLTNTSTYELAEGYGMTASYAASDRLRLRLGGQMSPRRFVYAVTPSGPFIDKQTQYDIFSGVTYSLNRRLRLSFDTGYQRRDTDFPLFDYESVYASLGVSVSL